MPLSKNTLYHLISASFCVIVIFSNLLSAKMVQVPFTTLNIPAGLVTYPFTFLLSDLVTEVFGAKRAKLMVYITLAMNLLSLGLIQISLVLPTSDREVQGAFQLVLGLSGLRIFSSLVSYLVSQVVDIQLYAAIKRLTGPKLLWLRNNASTFTSQVVDTMMVDLIFLWWGLGMTMAEVMPIMIFSYVYKTLFSAACTPFFYFLVYIVQGKQNTQLQPST